MGRGRGVGNHMTLGTTVAQEAVTAEQPLVGLCVLDLADTGGALCGKALADLGADVVKVEPPTGNPSRREPPFAGDEPGPDRSLPWLAYNANKRGITCDVRSPRGRELFLRLAERADVVVESYAPRAMERLGLGYATLAERNPAVILVSVSPYGQSGPLADVPGSDLEIMAAGGGMWLAGEPDGPPVRSTLPQTPGWAGMIGAMGALTAVLARDAIGGRGQHVDVSAQASVVYSLSHAPAFWDLLQEEQRRSGQFLTGRSVTGANFRNIWPCKDGYVTFAFYGGPAGRHTTKSLIAWMGERMAVPAILRETDWDTFDVNTVDPADLKRYEDAVAPFLLTLTRAEFFEGVVKRNMLGYMVATVEDISRDEQLEARDFWTTVPAPWDGTALRYPGTFALFNGTRPPITRTAPRLGEHNRAVYQDELGLTEHELATLQQEGVL